MSLKNISFSQVQKTQIPVLLELMSDYYQYDNLIFNQDSIKNGLEKLFLTPDFGQARFIIDQDQKIIGYYILIFSYCLEFGGKVAVLDELYLKPEVRGAGLGTHTLELIKTECKKQGLHALRLEVTAKNDQALKLYLKTGFEDQKRNILTCKL